MKKWLALLAAVCAAALCACAVSAPVETQGLSLWFPTPRGELTSALAVRPYEGEESIPGLMRALLAGPGQDAAGLDAAAPEGTALLNWSLESRVAVVTLSAPYGELEGMERTLADYCITLTLTQLNGVDGVRIAVEGSGQTPVLRAGDVVFSGVEEEPVDVPVALYFRLGTGGRLGYELRVFRLTEYEAPAKAVMEALCAGPEDAGLAPLLPEGLTVYSAWMEGGVCYVDLSAGFLESVPDSREEQELVIVSVVDTLCSLDAVAQVQILVEGQPVERYGEVDLSEPLFPGTAGYIGQG